MIKMFVCFSGTLVVRVPGGTVWIEDDILTNSNFISTIY